jgi:hypothetical protein
MVASQEPNEENLIHKAFDEELTEEQGLGCGLADKAS